MKQFVVPELGVMAIGDGNIPFHSEFWRVDKGSVGGIGLNMITLLVDMIQEKKAKKLTQTLWWS
ncbi:MAG: hypothetical protein JKX99_03830 [Robiginitomaculum sp.]|nr:hypothetical protein [Robiginitomaculum sp.]